MARGSRSTLVAIFVIPDAIGAGDLSKPSDGLHAHFSHYGYKDQVRAQIDLVDKLEADGEAYDANDLLYAFESSADYDPAPNLNAIIEPIFTINFADDLTNAPEHLHLPTASNYTEVIFPADAASYGHMTLRRTLLFGLRLFSHSSSASPTSANERSDRRAAAISQGRIETGERVFTNPNRTFHADGHAGPTAPGLTSRGGERGTRVFTRQGY